MGKVAAVINVILLLTLGVMLTESGWPTKSSDVWLLALLVAAPLASLIDLRPHAAESWLSLYLQRKALEERKRIEELNGKR
jgi:hypothetical protein